MNKTSLHLLAASCVFVCSTMCFGQITIDANKDAGFFAAGFNEGVPGFTASNLGAHTHVPVGQANSDRVNRATFQFDIAGNVTPGSVITNATFEFEVTLQGGPQGMAGVDFSLHRVTMAWEEGTGDGNIGVPSQDGVTWANAIDDPMTPVPWATLGGDFDAASSGIVFVDGPNNYSISSAKLIADIQAIVDGTADDFGFLLKADPEGVNGSAARVTSREGGNPARLVIEIEGTKCLLGDVNLDGVVDLLDVSPFVALVTSGNFQKEADINGDDLVNLLDVAPFVNILTGG